LNSGGSIDFHIHLYPPDVIRARDKIAESEPYFAALTSNKVHKWATLEDLLPRMERDNIERAVVGGFAFRDLGLCRACNDYIIDCVKLRPDKLDGICAVPPLARGFDKEILRCADAGILGVGELFPEGQGIDIADVSQTWRLAGTLADAGMFALLHTAEPVGHSYVGKGNVGPSAAAAFCMNHPETPVIFAHLGGGLWLYELMPEMRLYLSNAMYDLAAMPWLYGAEVLKMIEAGGLAGKFLFGTDYPILDSARYDKMFSLSGVSAETIESFRRGNATRILTELKIRRH
jgi:predicted TIM-barrel fold metal-dependent hydrolase